MDIKSINFVQNFKKMMPKNRFYLYISFLFISILIIFQSINYVENEGFNPSDDGVIIAQSYRLLNGEIPHKDFISIRPVVSAYLHAIYFNLPFPLEATARWFVILAFFAISLFWIFVLFSTFKLKYKQKYNYEITFLSLLLFAFILNLSFYNLFPCTTIDAILFSVLGFSLILSIFKEYLANKDIVKISFGLLFFSIASLTRQNFALITIIAFAFTGFQLFRKKSYKILIICFLIGLLPFLLYLILLIKNDTLTLFLNQMNGRTELFQTGVLAYAKSFINSGLLILNIALIGAVIYYKYRRQKNKTANLIELFKKIMASVVLLYSILTLFFSVIIFFSGITELFSYSFDMFWILAIFVFAVLLLFSLTLKQKTVLLFAVFLSWTSSISLGDNAPVFVIGILASTILYLLFTLAYLTKLRFKYPIKEQKGIIVFSVFVLIVFILSIFAQRKHNYRDLSASELKCNIGEIIPAFGNIKTNPVTFEYLKEIKFLYDSLNAKDKFVVVPNNAAIYPLLKSKNPFPLDWPQPAEYVGNENYLKDKLKEIIGNSEIYILIDKYNSKLMSEKLELIDYNQYDYFNLIFENSEEIYLNSKYFRAFRTK